MKPYVSILILICSVCLISFGIWNADVPLGDEAGHISNALKLIEEGGGSSNSYYLFYAGILKFITAETVNAHIVCRFTTSLIASVLMFIFLRSFSFTGSSLSVLLSVAFWISCRLNVPLVQFGNINLFCLCLIFPSLILVIRKMTVSRSLFFVLSLFWASKTRPEYNAPLLLFVIYMVVIAIFALKHKGMNWFKLFKSLGMTEIILYILLAISFIVGRSEKTQGGLDMYLRLGLDQCYTSLYSKLHPEKKISTMLEYREVTEDVFGPGGFKDACLRNPVEVGKYLALNGAINSIILVPGLIRHRAIFIPESYGKKGEMIQIVLFLAVFIFGTAIGIRKHISSLGMSKFIKSVKELLFKKNMIVLFILASSSSAGILLLIPDPRYWITFIPLVFLWIAWSVNSIVNRFHGSRLILPTSVLIVIVLCHPIFPFGSQERLSTQNNQTLIFKMRECAAQYPGKVPVVSGLYPCSLAIFAFGNNQKSVGIEAFSINSIKSSDYDFIAIDTYFRGSSFWSKNLEFMDGFEKNPEEYRYKLLGTTKDKYELSVYFRGK